MKAFLLTCAMSARIPFSLPLNVGGNSEKRLKNTVSPAALAPSRVTWNVLFVSGPSAVGCNVVKKLVQFVADAADTFCEEVASTEPSEPTREAVSAPEKVEPSANLKLKDAL